MVKYRGISRKRKSRKYFLVTIHRQENVDIQERLANILEALDKLQKIYQFPVICSLHPRTKHWMSQYSIKTDNKNIQFCDPFKFFDFIYLEQNSFCVLSDSGTVQEECCIFKVPNVTVRDVTERPETLECGSNILSGTLPNDIVSCVKVVVEQPSEWTVPTEYINPMVSSAVIKILSSNLL